MAKKRHVTAYQKSLRAIEEEGRRQCFMLYGAAAIALYRHHNMRQVAIMRVFEITQDVWQQCAADTDKSMIKMCYEETGIEIQNGSGKSWEDIPYLNGSINRMVVTNAQWVYIRQQQIKWIAPQIMACLILALHRKRGFGFDRCSRFYSQVQEIQAEYNHDSDALRKAARDLVGIDVADVTTKRRESA